MASETDADDPQEFNELFTALELSSAESANGRLRPTYVSGTHKTRIDHMLTSHPHQVQMVAIHRGILFQRDHAAIIASFKVHRSQAMHERWVLPLKQLRKAQFDGADADQVAEIRQHLSHLTVDLAKPAEEQIQSITAETMRSIAEIRATKLPQRHKVCDHWSPDTVAIELQLRLVVDIQHRISKQTWTRQIMQQLAGDTVVRLERLARGDTAQVAHFLTLTLFSPIYWQDLQHQVAEDVTRATEVAYTALRKLLTTTQKKKRRQAFLCKKRQLDLALQTGRLRAVITTP